MAACDSLGGIIAGCVVGTAALCCIVFGIVIHILIQKNRKLKLKCYGESIYFILTKGSILVCKWQNKSYTYIVSCNIFLSRRDFLFMGGMFLPSCKYPSIILNMD